jgi:hypothetical protein
MSTYNEVIVFLSWMLFLGASIMVRLITGNLYDGRALRPINGKLLVYSVDAAGLLCVAGVLLYYR